MVESRPALLHRCLIAVALMVSAWGFGGASTSVSEEKEYATQPGDTLVIHNDYGLVQIQPWGVSRFKARIQKVAASQSQLGNLEVISQQHGAKIFLQAYYYDYSSEAVRFEIWVPRYMNVLVSGANPAVEVSGLEGYVRVQTLSGSISASDLTSSVSLLSETGDIVFRAQSQPARDVRLESVQGNVQCRIRKDLNFRGWARAGGKLSWNQELELNQGYLERQIGLGGPLIYVSSLSGNVEVKLESSVEIGVHRSSTEPIEKPRAKPLPTENASPANLPVASTPPAGQAEPTDYTVGNGAPAGTVDTGYRLRVDVDWIYLNASVRDRYTNRSVPNLTQDAFEVFEDGVQQTIGKFETSEAPFHLLLLLDVSGSTREYLDLIKDASVQFTREIKSNDRIALATFNSDVKLRQDFTNDRQEIAEAIGRVRSGGGTAFYDALEVCLQEYMHGIEGRKAVVVFTDGVDNQLEGNPGDGSRITFGQLYREIQEIDALVYTIFLDTEGMNRRSYPPSRRRSGGGVIDILGDILSGRLPSPSPVPTRPRSRGDAYEEARNQLQMIADQTGGRMYSPRRASDLAGVYAEIADDLRVQYSLAYCSTNTQRDGKWRDIDVRLRNRPSLVVRTRKGYYAGTNTAPTKQVANR